jgi:transposase InsO family protein
MSLRQEFVMWAQQTEGSMSELCRRFDVSRKTAYKWLHRDQAEGSAGLSDRSRRPHRIARQLAPTTEQALVALRRRHPRWGARKIRRRLQDLGWAAVPACSSITAIFHRHGLIRPEAPGGRRDWQRFEHPAPNSLWQMDFKGPVRSLAGPGYPLTVLDDHSRFSLCLRVLAHQQTAGVQQALTATFRRYGLPNRILMDNGSPWGSDAEHPWSPLGVWLMRLGIRISHSRPYHPQTLGKDERFHRTLKEELLSSCGWQNLRQLQRAMDRWREEYNFERPHEALALAVPACRYQPSLRSFPERLPPIDYPSGVHVRKAQQKGEIFFKGRRFRIGKAFCGYPVGLRPTRTDGVFDVLFCHQRLTQIDLRSSP